jgi:DNA-binding transcriptional MerR regulator
MSAKNIDAALTIGRLSHLSQVDVATLRFYESSGLLEAQDRTDSGYRLYTRNSLARVQFIRRARETGYTLDQIAQILKLYDFGGVSSDIEQFSAVMLAEIDAKISGLAKWRELFGQINDYCMTCDEEHINKDTVDALMRGHCDKATH